MTIKILALDPGGTTGVCIFKSPTKFKSTHVKYDLKGIGALIKRVKPDLVVYERFVLYPATAKHLAWDEMYTSQVIGVIKYECMLNDIEYVEQSASDKDYVVYDPSIQFSNTHEKDAYGHAWYYYMKQKSI